MVRNACLNVIKHTRVKKEHVKHEMAGGETMHEGVSQSVIASELGGRIAEAMGYPDWIAIFVVRLAL